MEYDASFQSHERDIRFRLASECMEQILEKKKNESNLLEQNVDI